MTSKNELKIEWDYEEGLFGIMFEDQMEYWIPIHLKDKLIKLLQKGKE